MNQVNTIDELLLQCPHNDVIVNNMIIAWNKINSPLYNNIICSISGGADSDVVLDICSKVDKNNKIKYIWFNTGLEYQATKVHIKELEKKYEIEITELSPIKTIPVCCARYGEPFMSKNISEFISRLQRHNFQWENEPYEILAIKYPRALAALKWWCNEWSESRHDGQQSSFNIARRKWLKEFMIANPPDFQISNKCCQYAKKKVAEQYKKDNNCDLSITGIRKAEGGVRGAAYKSCFTENLDEWDEYRPIFWYSDKDKEEYKTHFNITYSDCYEKYGLDRTGCAGCPFGKYWENELDVINQYEPKFFKAVNNIFGKSYEYTKQYYEFCKEMEDKYGKYKNYLLKEETN